MRLSFLFCALLAGVCRALATTTSTNAPLPTYIFTLQPGVDADALTVELHLTPTRVYRHALNGFAAQLPAATVEGIKHDPRITAIESDGPTMAFSALEWVEMPIDRYIGDNLTRIGLTDFPPAQLNSPNARIAVNIAIMDTGVGYEGDSHNIFDPYHRLNVVQSAAFISQWTNAPDDYSGFDKEGHGTWVAAIASACATNNIGPVGVAPGAPLWSVRVLRADGTGTWAAFLAGMDYVVQHANEIEVANASLGGLPGLSQTNPPLTSIRQAVSNAVASGIVFIAAAGNFMQDIYGTNSIYGSVDMVLPAAIPEAMAVSAMNQSNNLFEISYSNFSSNVVPDNPVHSPGKAIDVCAPGRNVITFLAEMEWLIDGVYWPLDNGNSLWVWKGSGTSAAAPHVAGLAALYIAANGRATNAAGVYAIRQAIIDAGEPQSQWPTWPNTLDPDGNPEPLAMPSLAWIPPVKISAAQKTAQNFRLSFDTIPGYSYAVQSTTNFANTNEWKTFANTNGSDHLKTVTVTDPATNYFERYYRVQRAVGTGVIISTTNQTGSGTGTFYPTWTVVTNGSLVAGQPPSTTVGNFSEEKPGRNVNALTAGGDLGITQIVGSPVPITTSTNYVTCGNGNGAGSSIIYALTNSASGYDLTNITVYGGWADNGRDQQAYTIYYSSVTASTNFISLAVVNYDPLIVSGIQSATRVTLTSSFGVLATHVAAVKFDFTIPPSENGYCGYAGITVFGEPSISSP